jgi:hypothetical protein
MTRILICLLALLGSLKIALAADCEQSVRSKIAGCLEGAQRSAPYGDLSYIARCRDQYAGELTTCKQDGNPACEENIAWIRRDSGAWQTFGRARGAGLSTLEAALAAQQHNPNAQQTIRECGPKLTSLLEKYLSVPSTMTRNQDDSDLDDPATCAQVTWDNSDYKIHGPDLWHLQATVTNNCRKPFVIAFCARFTDQELSIPQYNRGHYGANGMGQSPVTFIGIKTKGDGYLSNSTICRQQDYCDARC